MYLVAVRFKGDGDNLEFKKFSERRGGGEPDGKPRFRSLGVDLEISVAVDQFITTYTYDTHMI